MKPTAADIKARARIDVDVTTIDHYMDAHDLQGFDLIKLDLQGNELRAIKGATRALESCKAVLTEVNFRERYEGCTLFNQLYDALAGAGFYLYKVYEIHGYPDGSWKLGDALFLKGELLRE